MWQWQLAARVGRPGQSWFCSSCQVDELVGLDHRFDFWVQRRPQDQKGSHGWLTLFGPELGCSRHLLEGAGQHGLKVCALATVSMDLVVTQIQGWAPKEEWHPEGNERYCCEPPSVGLEFPAVGAAGREGWCEKWRAHVSWSKLSDESKLSDQSKLSDESSISLAGIRVGHVEGRLSSLVVP